VDGTSRTLCQIERSPGRRIVSAQRIFARRSPSSADSRETPSAEHDPPSSVSGALGHRKISNAWGPSWNHVRTRKKLASSVSTEAVVEHKPRDPLLRQSEFLRPGFANHSQKRRHLSYRPSAGRDVGWATQGGGVPRDPFDA